MLTQTAGDGKLDAYPLSAYLEANTEGIRRHPYSFDMDVDPATFADFNLSNEVHDAGEIWTSALWDLNWLLVDKYGFDPDLYHGTGGNNLALQLVMDGLTLQPANPSFLEARDAILTADRLLTDGDNHDEIWAAFARRGLGFGADDGGRANVTQVTESFDLPPTSRGRLHLGRQVYETGETVTVTVMDRDLAGIPFLEVHAISWSGGHLAVPLQASDSQGVFVGSFNLISEYPGIGLRTQPRDTIAVTYRDEDDGSGQPVSVRQTAKVSVSAVHLDASFEGADGEPSADGFVTEGADNLWHLTGARGQQDGHSPSFSFHFGPEEDADDEEGFFEASQGMLTSPVVDLTSAEEPVYLSLNHFLDSNAWFDRASIQVLSGDETTVLADTQTTGGLAATDGFEPVQLDLSDFAGQKIQIQFEYDPDFFSDSEGWYIDDVRVRAPVSEKGRITFGAERYEVGDQVTVSLSDAHLFDADSVSVILLTRADDGDPLRDVESVTLYPTGGGMFRGAVDTELGEPRQTDGTFQVIEGAPIFALYDDLDDGTGHAERVVEEAYMAPQPMELFRAGFDTDKDGFVHYGISTFWHRTSTRVNGPGDGGGSSFYQGVGESEAGGGAYTNGTNGSLISPYIDLRGVVERATVEFAYWLQTERPYDTASVYVNDSYGRRIEIASSDDGTLPVTDEFTTVQFDISKFIGDEIRLEFSFRSDESGSFEGWYIDDVVVRGTPPGSRGSVRLDLQPYETGTQAVVTVADSDLAGGSMDDIFVWTGSGDEDTVRLEELHPGVFRGVIPMGSGSPAENGILEVSLNDQVTAGYYIDGDNGAGQEVYRKADADAVELLEVFHASFSDEDGNPQEQGFETFGGTNQWHLSRHWWRNATGERRWRYYFGASDQIGTPGHYDADAFGTLTSPEIDLRAMDELAVLDFRYVLNNQRNDDPARVLVLCDGSVTEIARSGPEGDLLEGTFFVTTRLDISEFVGHQIQVQFEFSSNDFLYDEGWHIDDVVVKGMPIGPRGKVHWDAEVYEVGQSMTISVTDRDLAGQGTVAVEIRSETGDVETVALDEVVDGRFQGTMTTALGDAASDGLLQVVEDGSVTVLYRDEDDGTGNEMVVEDSATVVRARVELLRADFTGPDGQPSADRFVVSGPDDPWHVSLGRSDEMGHSAGASFYFGAGEAAEGGGQYVGNASGSLTSPVIDLGALVDASLQFNHLLELEECCDTASVNVLTGGQSIRIAESEAVFWDDLDPLDEDSGPTALPPSRRFIPVEIDLSPFVGEQIQLQFDFQSDPHLEAEGWYIDDIVVKGTPIGAEGRVQLDADSYEAGQEVGILVADSDLRGSGQVTVTVSSAAGDVEPVTLDETQPGAFRGTITIAAGHPVANAALEIGARDQVLVEYTDRDDGTGKSVPRTALATAITLVEVLNADFHDESGSASAEGFSVDGPENQWHLSTGRGNDPGHTPVASFYFGAKENDQGNGYYRNDAEGTLVSPVIDLTPLDDTIVLEFNHFLKLGDEDDRARLLVAAGDDVVEIATSDWFFDDLLPTTEEFVPLRFDLSRFAGKAIRLQFELTTGHIQRGEGWYVDDVVIRAVPPVPKLDLNGNDEDGIHYAVGFVEDQGPVPIVDVRPAGPLSIRDDGGGQLTSATIRIVNPRDGDHERLAVTTAGTNIVQQVTDHTLTLTGTDTVANYETVLRSLTYDNTSAYPDSADRTITMIVGHNQTISQPAYSTISIEYFDSGPVRTGHDFFRVGKGGVLEVTADTRPAMDNAVGFGILGNDVTQAGDVGDPYRIVLVDSPHDRETGVATGRLQLNQDGTFVFTPEPDYEGTIQFSYQVDDGYESYGPAHVTIDVRAEQFLPTISAIPEQTIAEDTSTERIPFTVGATGTAVESLIVTAASSDQRRVPDANIVLGGEAAARTIQVTPAENQNGGPVTISVTVSDGSQWARSWFDVTIEPVNDAPSISRIPDQESQEDTSVPPIVFDVWDTETVSSSLVVGATSSNRTLIPNENVTIEQSEAGRIVSIVPAADQSGTTTIAISVSDPDGGVTTEQFQVTIDPVNDPPVIMLPEEQALAANASLQFHAAGGNAITIDDVDSGQADVEVVLGVDGGTLALAATEDLTSVTGNHTDSVTISGPIAAVNQAFGGLSYLPAVDFAGTVTLNVVVQDSGRGGLGGAKSVSDTLAIQVVDESPLTAHFVAVAPDPRAGAVESISLVFGREVTGLDVNDLQLTRSTDHRVSVPLDSATLTTTDNKTWILASLRDLTRDSGVYELTLLAEGSGITNSARTPLADGVVNRWTNGAGDVNEDREFNQFDLILVLQAAKYLTGDSAQWSEGDWDGNGLFNQFDVIAAQQTHPPHYLRGPFALWATSGVSTGVPRERDLGGA